jgi:hypothetical protein
MQLWGTREQQLIFLNSLGEARPARRATTRRTHRSRWLNPRRSLWHEERPRQWRGRGPLAHPTTLTPVHPGCGDR